MMTVTQEIIPIARVQRVSGPPLLTRHGSEVCRL